MGHLKTKKALSNLMQTSPLISNKIPADVHAEILRRIALAEAEHDVKVLYAIESGSRAWGFESSNSDYDARFIYINRKDWYLSVNLEEQRNVIEYPIIDDIDLNGWDLRKALRLFSKSNPAFIEWIQSPIGYVNHDDFANKMLELVPSIYCKERGITHYKSMARTNFRGYLKEAQVPVKKYFYVLRALLAVRWLETYGSIPPIEFSKMLHLIDNIPNLLTDILALMERKKAAEELGREAPIVSIQNFIESEMVRMDAFGHLDYSVELEVEAVSSLNEVFRSFLIRAWN